MPAAEEEARSDVSPAVGVAAVGHCVRGVAVRRQDGDAPRRRRPTASPRASPGQPIRRRRRLQVAARIRLRALGWVVLPARRRPPNTTTVAPVASRPATPGLDSAANRMRGSVFTIKRGRNAFHRVPGRRRGHDPDVVSRRWRRADGRRVPRWRAAGPGSCGAGRLGARARRGACHDEALPGRPAPRSRSLRTGSSTSRATRSWRSPGRRWSRQARVRRARWPTPRRSARPRR